MDLTNEQINDLAINQLTSEEIVLLRLRVNRSPAQIADAMGVSRQRVHDWLKRAVEKVEAQQK